ncbi:hypothetical protein AXF42_Ash014086 [Apostasia shenzhenica]|uniref:Uncharacterized protein n=1 Tax=Apostasia shenzhenica TaxID=1088818 RepID=A0A2I0A9B4_9ASPA|nr:hypothetical protein AXF42_Ash014086 [Apostasia shenzhenica]
MPRGHGRVGVGAEMFSERRSSTLSKRYLEKKNCMFLANAKLLLTNLLASSGKSSISSCTEKLCIVLSFLRLDMHLWKLLVPFSSYNQLSHLRNDSGSEHPISVVSLDSSLPHPAIFIQLDSQKEQSISPSQNCGFSPVKTVTDCRSSSIVGQPARIKRNRTAKNNPNDSSTISASSTDSSGVVDAFDIIASESSNQVDKPLKRSSRKKGKKKRKQCKKSMPKKASIEGETLVDEVNHDAAFSEISDVGDPAHSAAHTSDNELSPNVACPSLVVEISDVKGFDGDVTELSLECNTKEFLSRSSRSLGESLDRTEDSTKIVSLPDDHTDEGIDKMYVNNFVASSSTQLSKPSSSISLQNNPDNDMFASLTDSNETQLSFTNDGDFNSYPNMPTLISRNVSVEGECKEPNHQDNEASSSCSVNHLYWQTDVGDSARSTERALCSSQASSSDGFHPVIRAKRGRLARKFSGSSLNGSNAYLHGHTDRDAKHSIWQKVEKNGKVEFVHPKHNKKLATLRSSTADTRIRPKEVSGLKQNSGGTTCRYSSSSTEGDSHTSQSDTSMASPEIDDNSGHFSNDAINGSLTSTQPEKLKRKPNSSTEQESYTSVSESHISKKNILRTSNLEVEKGLETVAEFKGISLLTDSGERLSRSNLNLESNNMQQVPALENICSISHNTSSSSQKSQISSLTASNSDHSFADTQLQSNTNSSKDKSDGLLRCTSNEDEQFTSLKEGGPFAKTSGTDSIDGPALQKWVSIQADSVRNDLVSNDFKSGFVDECLSCSTVELQCSSPSSGYMDCSSPEEDDLAGRQESQAFMSSEGSTSVSFPSCLHLLHEAEDKDFPDFEPDLNKIMDAVDTSYRFLFVSEDFHLATGSRLAEFERILHSASPALCDMDCMSTCTSCSLGQINDHSLCSHQISSISLEKFWQWYEKPGSYGLEVKIDEFHKSKRSCSLPSEVCAFFVPYLSAIQLFSRTRKTACATVNDTGGDLLKTCDVYRTPKSSSCFGSLPIFSRLLPQPLKVADTRSKELSLSGKCEDFIETISNEEISDEDLLFEYFDSDQPQQRRPLFDKINQLVYESSNCSFSGDPSKLKSLNLKDVHPASWYAVAWYPIYRIPDGSFRAAFLTYHSFGSFIRRSTSCGNGGRTNFVVSPVVGLQSYNAKGECWFEPTKLNPKSAQSDEALSSYLSETLMGRIQSLEQAAHVMSRATVRKGDSRSVNIHPDYEFFLSRRR